MLISLLMTYLTVLLSIKCRQHRLYTAEFMPDEVLVGGLPFYFIEDHQGISPVNSLQSNPIDLLLYKSMFYWDKFLINWWFWLSLVLLVLFLKNMLKRSQLNH